VNTKEVTRAALEEEQAEISVATREVASEAETSAGEVAEILVEVEEGTSEAAEEVVGASKSFARLHE